MKLCAFPLLVLRQCRGLVARHTRRWYTLFDIMYLSLIEHRMLRNGIHGSMMFIQTHFKKLSRRSKDSCLHATFSTLISVSEKLFIESSQWKSLLFSIQVYNGDQHESI
jgi:hypothetical protein